MKDLLAKGHDKTAGGVIVTVHPAHGQQMRCPDQHMKPTLAAAAVITVSSSFVNDDGEVHTE
jgi:hypothetical protein